MKNLKITLTVLMVIIMITMTASVLAYHNTDVDTHYEINMPAGLNNGKGTVSTAKSGSFQYQFVEITAAKYATLKKYAAQVDLMRAYMAANAQGWQDDATVEAYDAQVRSYESKYETVAELTTEYGGINSNTIAVARSTWIHELPDFNDNNWTSSASRQVSIDLSTFTGTKYVVAWVKVGSMYDAEAYIVNGTKSDDPTPQVTTYTVIFKDFDGRVISTQTVEEGKGATAPANPSREGYVFTGWDKDYSRITSDLVVTAQYTKIPDPTPGVTTYTVIFKDYDGRIISTQTVEEGKDAIKPADPTRDGYTFNGWDKDFTNVKSDLIVVATYTKNADNGDNKDDNKDNNPSIIIHDNSQATDTKLPQTGVNDLAIIALMVVAALAGTVSYVKYRRIK